MKNPYLRIARLDHWPKNVFMVPGLVLAALLAEVAVYDFIVAAPLALLSTGLIASANYVINEWLDADFDRHHPVKSTRPSVSGSVKGPYVLLEYLLLIAAGLALASLLTPEFVLLSVALLAMGVIYNVRPLRLKDRVYLDVLAESLNNPLRLLLGWTALVSGSVLPSSVLLAYWMGGAFLMAVKRYAEYRSIADPQRAGRYRRSFQFYSERTLLLSAFFYALTSTFFLGIFLIKYRIELLLTFPLIAALFVWYLEIAMRPHSPTRDPEQFYRQRGFMLYIAVLSLVVMLTLFVDIPWLQFFLERTSY